MIEMRMPGRNALVTGSSKGIGLAIATNFAAAGANVVIVGRRKDALEDAKDAIVKAAGRQTKIVPVSADMSKAADCARTIKEATAALGQIDVLVNNAGTSQRGDFETVTDEVWQADLDLKLFAAIRLARAVFPGMKSRKWGRIINILNTGAKAPRGSSAPTSVTRAAGMALTKVLANEGAPHNVLVNALLVGLIESEQHEKRHASEGKGRSLADFYAEMGAGIPMKRVGKPEEFANMALFLASDAGSYVTGTAINIDGGTTPVV
jgi:NAD(P)-dependent dehydrogenase (short-subunit alcohol dehydrogenase family)